jgi:RNA polymerase sigma-70 factor (ECF subfamily)
VQETLLAIHQKRQTWREDAQVRPWLYAIVRYKVVDAFRARGRRVHVAIDDFADVLPAEAGPDPTERSDAERVIARLDPRSARIVRAIGFEGASVAELSANLEMTETAVRVALHRGLRKLAALREGMIE